VHVGGRGDFLTLMLFSVSMDGKLVVRKAIFRLRRRDARA